MVDMLYGGHAIWWACINAQLVTMTCRGAAAAVLQMVWPCLHAAIQILLKHMGFLLLRERDLFCAFGTLDNVLSTCICLGMQ